MSPSPDQTIAIIESATEELRGHPLKRRERAALRKRLAAGSTLGGELIALARSPEYVKSLVRRLVTRAGTDAEYVDGVYRALLDRPADPSGRAYHCGRLAAGARRDETVTQIAASDEHVNRVAAEHYPLPDLVHLHPDRYRTEPAVGGGGEIPCFVAKDAADFEWIAHQIDIADYYDRPGIWGSVLDIDKRTMAEIAAEFAPQHVLDLGCSNGTVMQGLAELGIDAEGIELSRDAVARAAPEIRDRIHLGDVTQLALGARFDLVIGLDIFEHVPPAAVGSIIDAVRDHLVPGGLVFANIPAFGTDPEFGSVFPMYVADWADDAAAGRPFRLLHVDEAGFPLHGHLTWADTAWWEQQFRSRGLARIPELERPLHARYDTYFQAASPPRQAFFVFGAEPDPARIEALAATIAADSRPLPAEC